MGQFYRRQNCDPTTVISARKTTQFAFDDENSFIDLPNFPLQCFVSTFLFFCCNHCCAKPEPGISYYTALTFFPRVLRIWSRTWKRAFLREVLHNAAILSNGSTKKMRNDTKKMSTEWEGFTNTRHCEDTRFFFFFGWWSNV